jgi:hypothetical protein
MMYLLRRSVDDRSGDSKPYGGRDDHRESSSPRSLRRARARALTPLLSGAFKKEWKNDERPAGDLIENWKQSINMHNSRSD